MKRFFCLVVVIFISVFLFACSGKNVEAETSETAESSEITETADTAENTADSRLYSDASAKEYLCGYWTDGQSNYLYASPTNAGILSYQTNLPLPSCTVYVLSEGILYGKDLDENGTVKETPVLEFYIVDDDTLRVHCLSTNQYHKFIRDTLTPDTSILEDEYVFWSMDHAVPYLCGEWESVDFNYLSVSGTNASDASFQTSLPYDMEGDYMDFVDGKLCDITVYEDGIKTAKPVFTFHILDENNLEVTCAKDDKTYTLQKVSGDIDPDNIDTDYVFFTASRAFPFLSGTWKEEGKGKIYFIVSEQDGSYGWKTNLDLPEHTSYTIHGGKLVGVDVDEEGKNTITDIYSFETVSKDEIRLTVIGKEEKDNKDNKVYTLKRQPDPSPSPTASPIPSSSPTPFN